MGSSRACSSWILDPVKLLLCHGKEIHHHTLSSCPCGFGVGRVAYLRVWRGGMGATRQQGGCCHFFLPRPTTRTLASSTLHCQVDASILGPLCPLFCRPPCPCAPAPLLSHRSLPPLLFHRCAPTSSSSSGGAVCSTPPPSGCPSHTTPTSLDPTPPDPTPLDPESRQLCRGIPLRRQQRLCPTCRL